MLAPNLKQRYAVIDLRVFPTQSLSILSASLKPFEEADVITRGIPEIPRNHAHRVPGRVPVGSFLPEVAVPPAFTTPYS